jgi:hypothetical protein
VAGSDVDLAKLPGVAAVVVGRDVVVLDFGVGGFGKLDVPQAGWSATVFQCFKAQLDAPGPLRRRTRLAALTEERRQGGEERTHEELLAGVPWRGREGSPEPVTLPSPA